MKLTRACAIVVGLTCVASDGIAAPDVSTRTLQRWAAGPPQAITINKTVESQMVVERLGRAEARPQTKTLEFSVPGTLSALAISGGIQLNGKASLARVILIDDQAREYLVYEAYPLITSEVSPEGGTSSLSAACQETCLLPNVHSKALRVELVRASITIKSVDVIPTSMAAASPTELTAKTKRIHAAQAKELVDVLNVRLRTTGLKWVAASTPISELTYAQKRNLFGGSTVPNLQGFEYYKAGIFELFSEAASPRLAASSFVPAFDWRARHRANDPTSPYYDPLTKEGGWMTPIKSQLCADCWAHASTGAVEAGINLYFNTHLDMDLSEQELVSCAGAGGCSGGNPNSALVYIANSGVVDEACFPESGWDQPCAQMCVQPQQRFSITGHEEVNPGDGTDNIKGRLINHGPMVFGIISWWHTMVLAGYDTDTDTGEPIWILKNSWGAWWGENGYGRLKVDLSDVYLTSNLLSPYVSQLKQYDIACRDEDHDGFYNWGLSTEKPASCGDVPPINDCNDADPTVALQQADGSCVAACKGLSISGITATPNVLWPPNHKMVGVVITATTKDDCDPNPVCKIQSVKSSEPDVGEPDWSITAELALDLRAERAGNGGGRLYTIGVACTDTSAHHASGNVIVTVPHDQGH
jgi:hypothetical protein